MMRSSWFHKLRRKSWRGGDPDDGAAEPVAPAPSPCSPNRASYYVPTRDRRGLPSAPATARDDNPKLRDTHFPRSPQASDIVFDVVVARRRDDRFNAMPDLKLRPIVTRHRHNAGAASPDTTSSAAASPTACRMRPRFHARPPPAPRRRRKAEEEDEACGRRSRRRQSAVRWWWMYESRVVVKDSADPEEDFLESMAEMIAANDGVRSPRGLEELLACYLALNEPDHHHAIVAAFRRAWVHLHSVSTQPHPPATTLLARIAIDLASSLPSSSPSSSSLIAARTRKDCERV